MYVRALETAAALAAAVAVYAAVRRRKERRRRREVVAARLVTGCVERDNAALRAQVAEFHRRMEAAVAQDAVVAEAYAVLDAALASDSRIDPRIDPFSEGGPL